MPALVPPSPSLPARDYVWDPTDLRQGNTIGELRAGGEAFPAMLAAIAGARHHVHFETYILRSDATGRRFSAALCEQARAGVEVRLLYDWVGSIAIERQFLLEMRDAGVEIVEYRPLARWRRLGMTRFSRRDHRKILVVDDEIAFTGGLNIGNEYAPAEEGGGGWFDMHVRVTGPVVLDFAASFRRIWVRAGGRPFPPPAAPATAPPAPDGRALAMIIDNREVAGRTAIRRAYLHAIQTARHSIRIMNAYFIPDLGVRWALRRAAKRGVDVRVIVPEHSDVPAARYASSYLFRWLMLAGVRIFLWPERMMHAKTAVVDRIWSLIGSYNLDHVSLLNNLEVVLAIVDPEVGERLHARYESDLEGCRELDLVTWKTRPLWQKLLEWLCFRLRRWL